ncbi:MAG: hypothetical protein VX614_00320 [Myxococcota bacterium]|nr:hypothetical protein [Myxococcota bacterium]
MTELSSVRPTRFECGGARLLDARYPTTWEPGPLTRRILGTVAERSAGVGIALLRRARAEGSLLGSEQR